MKTMYLAGHGEWNMRDGHATVARGCSISFYTEFSKNMFTTDMKAIIGGTYTGTVKQKIEEYKTCPNYTLNPDPASYDECFKLLADRKDANLALTMYKAGPAHTLSQLFATYENTKTTVELIWCACRFTGLKDAGGKTLGINGAQGTHGNRDNFGRLIPPGGALNTDNYYFNPTTKIIKNL